PDDLDHLVHQEFFCQAEDGIRDDLVTGVQTCALPISISPRAFIGPICAAGASKPWRRSKEGKSLLAPKSSACLPSIYWPVRCRRSEERRVGNGWGGGWSHRLCEKADAAQVRGGRGGGA